MDQAPIQLQTLNPPEHIPSVPEAFATQTPPATSEHINTTREINVQGLTLRVDTEAFNDFELLDALEQVESGNPLKAPALLRAIVGDQYKTVMDHLRTPSGRVPAGAAASFMLDLMQAISPES